MGGFATKDGRTDEGLRVSGQRAHGFANGTYGVPSSDRWTPCHKAPEGPPMGGDVEVTRTPIRRVGALAARQQHGAYAFLPPPGGLDHSGDHRRYRAELVLHQWSELPARRYLGSAGAL